jgi:hypothetical protein
MGAKKKKFEEGSAASGSEIIIYQTEGGQTKLEVRLQDESVWLTQPLMAELFQTTPQNISLHISNIYDEGELTDGATHKKYLSVQPEGTDHAESEYDKFHSIRIAEMSKLESDFDKAVNMIEEKKPRGIVHAKK